MTQQADGGQVPGGQISGGQIPGGQIPGGQIPGQIPGGRTSPAGGRRGAGELEAEVLGTLWGSKTPLTPAQLHVSLGGGLAYNTVHTILTRLCDKGQVRRTTVDGRPAYAPAQGAAEWAAGQMRAVLDRSGDRSAILHRFVSSLDPADEQILRAALREERP